MNPIGLTSKFFLESTHQKWDSVRSAGFENVEIAFPMKMGDQMVAEANRRRMQASDAGLHPSSAHLPYHFCYDFSSTDAEARMAALQHQRSCLEIISDWEIPIAIVHSSKEPIMDFERPERIHHAADGIAELSAYANKLGVVLAVEDLPRTCLGNTSSEIALLIENSPSARVNLDFNHLMRETHAEFIDRLADKIITTHISDYDIVYERHWAPGIGRIDWKNSLKHLTDSGYTGQFMIETIENIAMPDRICTPAELMQSFKNALLSDKA